MNTDLRRFFPILDWGRTYDRKAFSNDMIAAVIVTIMLIPQSLAYALLAGLPPEAGIYASIAPIILYAVFGTSRALAVGPVAVVSLLTASAIGQVAEQGTAGYAVAALTLAFLSGGFLLLMGVFRLGFLANFLSHPVIAGFITASGVLIATSQVKHILGVSAHGHTLPEMLMSILSHLDQINWITVGIEPFGRSGKVPAPGPQNGRYASEPLAGLTSLKEFDSGKTQYNASAQLATDIGDTIKRIDGTEVPLLTPWQGGAKAKTAKKAPAKKKAAPKAAAKTEAKSTASSAVKQKKPRVMKAPRKAGADDLKMIKGVGPKLEDLLHSLGFFHFDQVSKWTAEEVAWVDENLEGFKGRVSRDDWVSQAKILADGGATEFSKRARKDGRYDG